MTNDFVSFYLKKKNNKILLKRRKKYNVKNVERWGPVGWVKPANGCMELLKKSRFLRSVSWLVRIYTFISGFRTTLIYGASLNLDKSDLLSKFRNTVDERFSCQVFRGSAILRELWLKRKFTSFHSKHRELSMVVFAVHCNCYGYSYLYNRLVYFSISTHDIKENFYILA